MKLEILSNSKAWAVAAMALLGMSSCTKLASNLKYDLNLQTASVNFTIPACSTTSLSVTGSQTVYYNVDSFIKANTMSMLGVSNIQSVKIMSCNLELLDGTTTNNFANISSCSGGFSSDAVATPFVTTVANNPDAFSNNLTLPVDTTAELKDYIRNSNNFTYSLTGSLRRPTTDSLHCKATFAFKVRVSGI